MTAKPKLTYFDMPASRGEECRLAFVIAGVEFEDVRVKRDQWLAMKASTPYGSMPLLELPGKPVVAHTDPILKYIGREHGVHPTDAFEALRHEGMMNHMEDMRTIIGLTINLAAAEKQSRREYIAKEMLPEWARHAEDNIGDGPFFAGAKPNVVDCKLYIMVRWLTGGKLDHIPTTIVSAHPKLMRVHDTFRDLPAVKAWNARFQ